MLNFSQILKTWKIIYKKPGYLFSAIFIAVLFYTLNVLIQHQTYLSVLDSYRADGFFSSFLLFCSLNLGFYQTIYLRTFISIILTGILIGMFFTLIAYKSKALRSNPNFKNKKLGVLGSIGLFLGIAAPGCTACGVGLLALLGISGTVLSFLPFEGFEISILALLILAISVLYMSKGLLVCDSCEIQLKKDSIVKLKN